MLSFLQFISSFSVTGPVDVYLKLPVSEISKIDDQRSVSAFSVIGLSVLHIFQLFLLEVIIIAYYSARPDTIEQYRTRIFTRSNYLSPVFSSAAEVAVQQRIIL